MKLLLDNWEILLAIGGPILAWIGGRSRMRAQLKKAEAEAKDVELGTISSNFKVYQDLINDLEDRFKRRIEELEEDLGKMKTLNTELRKAISNQERYIERLKEKLKSYEELEG